MPAGVPAEKCSADRMTLDMADHPYPKTAVIGPSARSAGKKYRDTVRWKQSVSMSKKLGDLGIQEYKSEDLVRVGRVREDEYETSDIKLVAHKS